MSRVYLSFSLPEDKEELEHAWKGAQYKSFIDEFDQKIFRAILKYDDLSMLDVGISKESLERDQNIVDSLRQIYWRMYKEVVEE